MRVGALALLIALLLALPAVAAAPQKPLKVYILAGQSNMQGQGIIKADPKRNDGKGSLEFLVKDAASADRFKDLVDKDGKWVSLDRVWISYLDRSGPLTVGYGATEKMIGPELGFGHTVAKTYDGPILLIKLAWGGKSLAKDFRPPSSGGEVGPFYTEIITRTKAALADLKKADPSYDGQGYELAGFGWHQGWNDRINQAFNDEYEKNLANLIRDVRKDLGVKALPFVVAETGMTGPTESNPRALSLMKAQAAVAEYPEFKGNVAFVGTRAFWRPAESSPSAQGYHWNNNAETYYLIGTAMGEAMTRLSAAPPPVKEAAAAPQPSDTYSTQRIEGWVVHVNKKLLEDHPKMTARAIELMIGQLKAIVTAVPPKAVEHLQKIPLWVNPEYPKVAPRRVPPRRQLASRAGPQPRHGQGRGIHERADLRARVPPHAMPRPARAGSRLSRPGARLRSARHPRSI